MSLPCNSPLMSLTAPKRSLKISVSYFTNFDLFVADLLRSLAGIPLEIFGEPLLVFDSNAIYKENITDPYAVITSDTDVCDFVKLHEHGSTQGIVASGTSTKKGKA